MECTFGVADVSPFNEATLGNSIMSMLIFKVWQTFFLHLEQDSMDLKVEFETHFGIAHTRWATHGVPSAVNSHPQRSDKGNGMWYSLAPRPSGCDWPCDVCVRIDTLSTPTGFSAALSLLSIQLVTLGPRQEADATWPPICRCLWGSADPTGIHRNTVALPTDSVGSENPALAGLGGPEG